jgi:hypothetical protein
MYKKLFFLFFLLVNFSYLETKADYYEVIKFGKYYQAITVFDKQVKILMKK